MIFMIVNISLNKGFKRIEPKLWCLSSLVKSGGGQLALTCNCFSYQMRQVIHPRICVDFDNQEFCNYMQFKHCICSQCSAMNQFVFYICYAGDFQFHPIPIHPTNYKPLV